MLFKGHTVQNQPAANWKQIYRECAKYERFLIEVRKFELEAEISLQQMKWLHCENGPIRILADYQGVSEREAQSELKRRCGRQWFVEPVNEENCNQVEGQIFYECQRSFCNKLFHPVLLKNKARLCPCCGSDSIALINIKSKTALSVNQTNKWFEEIFDWMDSIGCRISQPDPNWKLNRAKEKDLQRA